METKLRDYFPAFASLSFWKAWLITWRGALALMGIVTVPGGLLIYGVAKVCGTEEFVLSGQAWLLSSTIGLSVASVFYCALRLWQTERGGGAAEALEEIEGIQFDLNGQVLDGKTVFGAFGGAFQDTTRFEDWILTIAISAAPIETTRKRRGVSMSVSAAPIHADQQIDALANIVRVAVEHEILVRDVRDEDQAIMKARYKLTSPKGLEALRAAKRLARKSRPDLGLVLSSRERWRRS